MHAVRPTTRRRAVRLAFVPMLAAAVLFGSFAPAPSAAATTWTKNIWSPSGHVYQDPYYTACVAASVMIMLNTIAYRQSGGEGFAWTQYRVRHNSSNLNDTRDMTSILYYARKRDTLRSSSAGTDAHGWRNALNAYGWGAASMLDPERRVYEDRAYTSMDAALRASVIAIARLRMPVGILAWAGGHAQVMTGYEVSGADPRVSDDFQILAVYLSDPLRSSRIVNRRTTVNGLRTGSLLYRFQRYRETDSQYDDPYTPGSKRSSVSPSVGPSEWYGRWVVILPTRPGLPPEEPAPASAPAPTPTPSPSPAAAPAAVGDPAAADPSPSADASPPAEPTPAPEDATPAPEDATPMPEDSPEPADTPKATPAAPPSEAPASTPGDTPPDPPADTPPPSADPPPAPPSESPQAP